MQAVIRTGGKQYIVKPGQTLEVDLLPADTTKLELDTLLVIDGAKIQVGAPTVAGVKVTAEVIAEVKGEKLKILKYKAKKRIKTQTGHRQRYSQIKITAIGSAKAAAPKAAAKPASKPAAKKPAKATA